MNLARRGPVAASVSVALFLAACTASGSSNPSRSPNASVDASPGIGPYVEGDLAGILQAPTEPPDGYKFLESFAGNEYLPNIFNLPTGQRGYTGGAGNSFIPTAATQQAGDAETDGAIESGAWLFVDADDAAMTFQLDAEDYRNRSTARNGQAPVSITPNAGLGEDSFGIQGSWEPGFDAFDFVLYAWQHSNLVLYVLAWGPQGVAGTVDPAQILSIATDMESRATKQGE